MTSRLRSAHLLVALASGAAAALAFPPFGLLPGVLGFSGLLYVLDAPDVGLKGAFARGWIAGAAYFLISTWWVAEAFLVDAEAHAWQAPFAVGLLAGGLALLWGGAGVVYKLLAPGHAGKLLVFGAVFGLEEWLRGHVLTGFPWDLPGEVWRAGSAVSQAAAVVGAYGLSLLTLIAAAALGLAFRRPGRGERVAILAAAVTLALVWTGGAIRLSQARDAFTPVRLRVVQPDIPQSEKWSPQSFTAVLEDYVNLSRAPGTAAPDVVIWPEAALPAPMEELLAPDAWTRPMLLSALRPGELLLAGAVSVSASKGTPIYHNSLIALRRTATGAEAVARYDKHHLVPFGEYTPLDRLAALVGFKALVHLVGDGFTPGPASMPIVVPGLGRLQPLICYESLFPGSFARTGLRPTWIVNVSNDAWFGDTSGPWQHLNLASYRAIEEGLPIVRATPTGVSAVIDPYGRALSVLPLGRRGVLDQRLPAPVPPTPYERWRDWPFFAFSSLGLAATLVGRRRRPLRSRLKGG